MPKKVRPIPKGYHTVTASLTQEDSGQTIEFCKKAFGAKLRMKMPSPNGKIMHAEVSIGDSVIMLGDASEEFEATRSSTHLYVDDVDAAYERALQAGGESLSEPQDQFYGDRSAGVRDRFGNQWWMATHVEDVSMEEMQRRQAAMAQA